MCQAAPPLSSSIHRDAARAILRHWGRLRCRSFGGLWLCVSGGCLLLLLPEQPALQPVEVDIDNRCRIEREDLRQSEAADDGIAERLANPRPAPGPTHPRHPTEQP